MLLFVFVSHSCHLGTLEAQDRRSDYPIRLDPYCHLQAADRTAVCKTAFKQGRMMQMLVPLLSSLQGLGGVPGSQPMLPSGMDPTRQQGLHKHLHNIINVTPQSKYRCGKSSCHFTSITKTKIIREVLNLKCHHLIVTISCACVQDIQTWEDQCSA